MSWLNTTLRFNIFFTARVLIGKKNSV